MTYEEFWGKIEITEEEKVKSTHYLKYRGVEEHNYVRQYLESVTGRTVSYAEIATAFRYDKRIRRILYKYIGLLEESIRAFICNKYGNDYTEIMFTESTQKNVDKYGNLYAALSALTFGKLIKQVKRMFDNDKGEMFLYYTGKIENLSRDLDAIVSLRNEVSHNRFLLDSKRLKKTSVGDGNGSLWENIVNLLNCLPPTFQHQFTKEINGCAQEGSVELFKSQTQWALIEEIVVKII